MNEHDRLIQQDRLSNYSAGLGNAQNFGEVRRQIYQNEIQTRKQDLLTDLVFLIVVLAIVHAYGKDSNCGIPAYRWTNVYLVVLGIKQISNFLIVYLQSFYYRRIPLVQLLLFVVVDGFIAGWLIYGNVLFYSSKDDCNSIENSKSIYNVMLVLLIIGYFQLLGYAMILILLPFLIVFLRNQQRGQRDINDNQIPQVLQSLAKHQFNVNQFQGENVCSICMNEYTDHDEVTPLVCNPMHYFHTACIEDWIKVGKNSCPLCRKPI